MAYAASALSRRATSTATDAALTNRAATALRTALKRGSSSARESLRPALGALCLESKQDGVPIERLLIALKDAWVHMPEVQAVPLGTARSALLENVISACIAEFYRESR